MGSTVAVMNTSQGLGPFVDDSNYVVVSAVNQKAVAVNFLDQNSVAVNILLVIAVEIAPNQNINFVDAVVWKVDEVGQGFPLPVSHVVEVEKKVWFPA